MTWIDCKMVLGIKLCTRDYSYSYNVLWNFLTVLIPNQILIEFCHGMIKDDKDKLNDLTNEKKKTLLVENVV